VSTFLYVFAYDIERDSTRAKVAAILEAEAVRVQGSVFEGRMSKAQAKRLSDRIAARIHPTDSLRVYALTSDGLDASFVHGVPPLPEKSGFMLL
jgi:CRISPR-associated protein Cas2